MALFNRKKKSKPGQAQVAQESVPSPAPQPSATATPATTMAPTTLVMPTQPTAQQPVKGSKKPATRLKKPGGLRTYLEGVGAKKKGLEIALRQQNVKTSLYEFVRNMFVAAVAFGIVIAITVIILFQYLGLALLQSLIFGVLLGVVVFYASFQTFLNFPTHKTKSSTKNIERDILFAARDMIISLRSGMPLFNAITSISTGYGDASKEFAKIIERVQLGMPLEDAIDQTVSESKSQSFRRVMLQAAVSIRAGADVVGALQSVIDQLSQERIIELRRYGQRLNAIAMFYMLFGIILPSMGIAVITILTTFIAIFTVNDTILEFALVGIIFLQIVFLKMITSSRPVFTL
jgi:flagellar protein FlaJ